MHKNAYKTGKQVTLCEANRHFPPDKAFTSPG